MIIISAQSKYFPPESLKFWEQKRCFSGIWEQVETGGYLPIVVIDGENLGVDGDPDEIEQAKHGSSYMVSGWPAADYIGCKETANAVFLFWKDGDGKYYQDILGVMEAERWFQDKKKSRKK